MKAIVLEEFGEPSSLTAVDIAIPVPRDGTNDILVEVIAAGVHIDDLANPSTDHVTAPYVPGREGVGRVVSDPTGLIASGTKIAWAHSFGSYAEYALVDRTRIVAVPDSIDDLTAAAMLLNPMTAHALATEVFPLNREHTVLIADGAGGVELILTQLARERSAQVLSLVATREGEELSYQAGATKVFRCEENLTSDVHSHCDDAGVDVAFEATGSATHADSLACVKPGGSLVIFGQESGLVDAHSSPEAESIRVLQPVVDDYTSTDAQFTARAHAVVGGVVDKQLHIHIGGEYLLEDAEKAHRDIQTRQDLGSVVLKVK